MPVTAMVHVNDREAINAAFGAAGMSIPEEARMGYNVYHLYTILREAPGFLRRVSSRLPPHKIVNSEDEYYVKHLYRLRGSSLRACVEYERGLGTLNFYSWTIKIGSVEVSHLNYTTFLAVTLIPAHGHDVVMEGFEIQVPEGWATLDLPDLDLSEDQPELDWQNLSV